MMTLGSFLTFKKHIEPHIEGIEYCDISIPSEEKWRLTLKDLGEKAEKPVRIWNIEMQRPNENLMVWLKVTTDESDEFLVSIACWDFKNAAAVIDYFANFCKVRAF